MRNCVWSPAIIMALEWHAIPRHFVRAVRAENVCRNCSVNKNKPVLQHQRLNYKLVAENKHHRLHIAHKALVLIHIMSWIASFAHDQCKSRHMSTTAHSHYELDCFLCSCAHTFAHAACSRSRSTAHSQAYEHNCIHIMSWIHNCSYICTGI